ncbi:hypothetical protein AMJ44_10665 [candidate division WOR-1 bacterium DG_54_3]|uniref:Uncharacterized protein n=1 Tax=candidate division WOR-1 bacterium DG_54_3 TaxID=1703775 RepID=A0A0S7XS00_UNCSA|nr:MAG: hypothetical protein AMJ44_10665 [candidate division WOR-1 bacterium DG_54_3]
MKGLMLNCRNLEKEGCHPKVIEYKKRIDKDKKDNPEHYEYDWFVNEFVRDLDAICRQCESHFFWIEEKECPICNSCQFNEIKGFQYYQDDIKIREDSFVACLKCGTLSRLIKWLI